MSDEGRVHLDLEELDLPSLLNQFSLECSCVGQHAESVAVLVQVFLELDPSAVLDPSTAVVFAPTVEDFLVLLLDLLLSTQALF